MSMNKAKAHSCIPLILVLSTLLFGACGGSPKPVREPLDLTILHTGQVYGEIMPCG